MKQIACYFEYRFPLRCTQVCGLNLKQSTRMNPSVPGGWAAPAEAPRAARVRAAEARAAVARVAGASVAVAKVAVAKVAEARA